MTPEFKSYSERRSWSDSHLDVIKSALGKRFFKEASFVADTKFGIDLYIPTLQCSVRVRQLKYQNFRDFTIRTSSGNGKSEYAKLLDKTAPEYLFYGFALDSKTLAAGYLIDIQQWKVALKLKEIKPMFRRNKDGSHFIAFPFYNPKKKPYLELISFVEQII